MDRIIGVERPATSILAIIGDNGPTWAMSSLLTQMYWFRLFKKRQLDVLVLGAQKAGASRFNWHIEHLWSSLSKLLTGITYDCCFPGDSKPACLISGLDAGEVKRRELFVFDRAAKQQSGIWNNTVFSGHKVTAEVPPPLHDVFSSEGYEQVKEFMSIGVLRIRKEPQWKEMHKEFIEVS
jgi:hypothetical protein